MNGANSRTSVLCALQDRGLEPFAFELFRRFTNGESAEDLSRCLGIPLDRIQVRLNAAAAFFREHKRVPIA